MNESEGSLQVNVQRLKEYLAKLQFFKAGEKPAVAAVTTQTILPIKAAAPKVETHVITDAERKVSVYEKLRKLYADTRAKRPVHTLEKK